VFVPDEYESQDGCDIVEFLAQQPWCDGQVTMWGGSYAGMNQWLTLNGNPAHLRTIVPVASAQKDYDYPFRGPARGVHLMDWLYFTSGKTGYWNMMGESSFWIRKWHEIYHQHLPYVDLDKAFGMPQGQFQDQVGHQPHDPIWHRLEILPEDYQKFNIPILTIAGHYDDAQRGSLITYLRHKRWGTREGWEKHYVVVGPWDHDGTRNPKAEVGGVKFGGAALLDLKALHVEWYDWTMRSGPKPAFLQKRAVYYVIGAEEWRYTDDLEEIATTRRLYLSSQNGQANEVFRAGSLQADAPAASQPDTYTYDPLDTLPASLEQAPIPPII
jgi:putative CocE/NonD family hydrolase